MNQYYYCKNKLAHTSLNKASNYKNYKIEESKPKTQKLKASNLNNFWYIDPKENVKTVDRV